MFRHRRGPALGLLLLLQGAVQTWVAALSPFLIAGIGPADEPASFAQRAETNRVVALSVVLILLMAFSSFTAGVGLLRGWQRAGFLLVAGSAHLGAAVALVASGRMFLAAGALFCVAPIALAIAMRRALVRDDRAR